MEKCAKLHVLAVPQVLLYSFSLSLDDSATCCEYVLRQWIFILINIVSWWCWTTNHAPNSDWTNPLKLITHEDVSTLPLWWIRGAKTGLYSGKKMQTECLISALFPTYAILEWEWEERSSPCCQFFFTFYSTYVCMCSHHRVTKTERDDTARLLRE
jgi:hypothetical protein